MRQHYQGGENAASRWRSLAPGHCPVNACHSNQVEPQQGGISNVETCFAQMAIGEGDRSGKGGRRIGSSGEPVIVEQAAAAGSQAVEEVLVLIRVIERCLRVSQGEEQ